VLRELIIQKILHLLWLAVNVFDSAKRTRVRVREGVKSRYFKRAVSSILRSNSRKSVLPPGGDIGKEECLRRKPKEEKPEKSTVRTYPHFP
jgi:hypothetical protein